MHCLVTAGKHVKNIQAIARQPPITKLERLLEGMFSFGSAPGLYSEVKWSGLVNDRYVLSSERAPAKGHGSSCQRVTNIWSRAPDGARHQDKLTD
jgi:hypothetical protein